MPIFLHKLDSDTLTTNNFYTQKLTLTDSKPVFIKNYRLPYSQKAEIEAQVNSLLKNNVIEPSVSSYNSTCSQKTHVRREKMANVFRFQTIK